jgi:hypothetical protein
MKVSGFSFIRNAIKYDYPIIESILSILPLVDEYVIAVGNSEDGTRELISSLNNDKIKIIDTIWDDSPRFGDSVLAVETNKAFQAVSKDSDWAFYLQGDECIHEKDYDAIRESMLVHLENKKVDGFLFKYHHFYGNYNYTGAGKRWYRNEIRIIRNDKNIISWKDAQGFRFNNNEKLSVKKIDAHIYHYGWVKPPKTTNQKALYFQQLRNSEFKPTSEQLQSDFDFHNIDRLDLFKGTHPSVMYDRINKVNWNFEFDTFKRGYKNMKFKHKVSHFIEDFTGYRIGEYKNYKLV